MSKKLIFGFGIVCALLLGLMLAGCGDDDDDGAAGSPAAGAPAAGSPAAGSPAAGADGAAPTGDNTLKGVVWNYPDDIPIGGITVRVMDNDTGDSLGIETVSADDGTFSLTGLPDGMVGLLAVGDMDSDPQRMDTYVYNVESNETDRQIYSFPHMLGDLVTSSLGASDPTTGGASGTVYIKDAAGELLPIDCVVVAAEGQEAEVYYINESGLPDATLTEHTMANGRFYMRGLSGGPATITASVDGVVMGTVQVPIATLQESTGGQYNSNTTYIILEGTEDPTPECVP